MAKTFKVCGHPKTPENTIGIKSPRCKKCRKAYRNIEEYGTAEERDAIRAQKEARREHKERWKACSALARAWIIWPLTPKSRWQAAAFTLPSGCTIQASWSILPCGPVAG